MPVGREEIRIMASQDTAPPDITVLVITGQVTIGAGDIDVRETVQSALAAGGRKIVLDMSGVTRLDSSGIGELISAYASVKNRGGRMAIAGLSPRLATVLQVTQLVGILELHDTVSAAASALRD